MLEEYSAGRILTIQSEGVRYTRKKKAGKSTEAYDEEFGYENESDEPYEKNFTFLSEITTLVNFNFKSECMSVGKAC